MKMKAVIFIQSDQLNRYLAEITIESIVKHTDMDVFAFCEDLISTRPAKTTAPDRIELVEMKKAPLNISEREVLTKQYLNDALFTFVEVGTFFRKGDDKTLHSLDLKQLEAWREEYIFDRSYDAKWWWTFRGKDYQEGNYEEELEYLYDAVKDETSVLEIGSGSGMAYEYLKHKGMDLTTYRMCDISETFLDACEERVGARPDLWDGKKLPYTDKSFDTVVLFNVLLHVDPSNLYNFVGECVRVAKKFIFISTAQRTRTGVTIFGHDHEKLFNHFNLKVLFEKRAKKSDRRNWFLEI